jgi:hypothetical protein
MIFKVTGHCASKPGSPPAKWYQAWPTIPNYIKKTHLKWTNSPATNYSMVEKRQSRWNKITANKNIVKNSPTPKNGMDLYHNQWCNFNCIHCGTVSIDSILVHVAKMRIHRLTKMWPWSWPSRTYCILYKFYIFDVSLKEK